MERFFEEQPSAVGEVVRVALAREGHELELLYLPRMRSLSQANRGVLDGDLARTIDVSSLAENLVKVPTPLCHTSYYLYAPVHSTTTNHWADFQNPKPVMLSDMLVATELWPESLLSFEPLKLPDTSQALRAIEKGQANILLLPEGILEILTSNKPTIQFIKLHPVIAHRDAFLWLHKRHAVLAEKLGQHIQNIKQSLFDSGRVTDVHFTCGTLMTLAKSMPQ
ncbi:hypothetical protein R50073_37090 [Maricurvus nonylphenolicus]